jgi:hypothetical protein
MAKLVYGMNQSFQSRKVPEAQRRIIRPKLAMDVCGETPRNWVSDFTRE